MAVLAWWCSCQPVRSRNFDRKIEALQALRRSSDPEATRDELRKALDERNSYLVARAATIIAELNLADLIPDLVAAFERFFVDPVKSDPRCLAKTAIANALKDLGERDPEPYVRGIVPNAMDVHPLRYAWIDTNWKPS